MPTTELFAGKIHIFLVKAVAVLFLPQNVATIVPLAIKTMAVLVEEMLNRIQKKATVEQQGHF